MFSKEKIDRLLSRIGEDKREAFLAEVNQAEGLENVLTVLKKYGLELTEEDLADAELKRALAEEDLNLVAGGVSGYDPGIVYGQCKKKKSF